jgi:Flp pilus assembly protein TadD
MIEIAPQLPFGYEAYAASLAEVGRDEEAAEEYRKALDCIHGPTMFRSWILYHLGMIEVRHSQAVQAVEHLSLAVQIAPENPVYHRGLGQALREEGRMDEASEELRLEAELRQRLP